MAIRLNNRLLQLTVENFRTLTRVTLPLGPLTVLVGPNAAGKSNVLKVFDFLSHVARDGIQPTIDKQGGFQEIAFRGGHNQSALRISLDGIWTEYATESSPDRYSLSLQHRRKSGNIRGEYSLSRRERFVQNIAEDVRSTVDLVREKVVFTSPLPGESPPKSVTLDRLVSGLQKPEPLRGTGPTLTAVLDIAQHLTSIRIFDADVRAARHPTPIGHVGKHLLDDASNLADFLWELQSKYPEIWEVFLDDMKRVVRDIENVEIRPSPEAPDRLTIALKERGLRGRTQLADASFGTVRLICLLALFHDPEPPILTCIEEIDHGLHPHALRLLADRLREASERAQFIAITHSPVLVDELNPDEVVVCERDRTGPSIIPAINTAKIYARVEASEGMPLGKLWFSGMMGGDL